PMVKAWFQEGKDDPNLTLIKVTPEDVYYWEPKHNKMITLFNIAVSAVSGKQMDVGRQGRIEI
ncbi:MAG TPA: pyridoxamine 5'-phosphate oxidase family protein, partial [Chryseosolibacter sp.]